MSMSAVAIGGATLAGAAISADSARSAGNAQADAVNSANARTDAAAARTREDLYPYMHQGALANNKLSDLLGLSSEASRAYIQDLRDHGFNLSENWVPYQDKLDAFVAANPQYNSGGELLKNFSQEDLQADPIYQNNLQYGMESGTNALNRLAAAGGNLNSGAQLKALTKFGTNEANMLGGQAYDRFTSNQNNKYNKLMGVSQLGQSSAAGAANAGMSAAGSASNNLIGLGNANASASLAGGNQLNSGLNSLSNYYTTSNLLGQLNNRGASGANGIGAIYGDINGSGNGFRTSF